MPTRHLLSFFLCTVACQIYANPVPLVNNPLSPESAVPGSAGFTLTVSGTGFVSGAVVNWNGHGRTTVFVSGTRLTATILASDVAAAGTTSVSVSNPAPGGGTSNVVFFQVRKPVSALALAGSTSYPLSAGASSVALGDLNQDGKLDMVIGSQSASTVTVMLGNGNGTFQPAATFPIGGTSTFVAIADFNNDGIPDLAVGNPCCAVDILLGKGDGTFQPYSSFPTSGGSKAIAVGDFDADGNLDLAVLGSTPRVTILLGNGNGTLQPGVDYSLSQNNVLMVVAGDFNRDGRLDLAVAGNGGINILLGNGDGTFQSSSSIAGQYLWLAAADFNGDGILDLAAPTEFGSIVVLLGNGEGTFQTAGAYRIGQYAGPLVTGDFNGDGKLDLAAAANSNSVGAISMLLGNGDGTFQPPSSNAGQGVGGQLAAGDFLGHGALGLAFLQSGAVSINLQTAAAVSPSLLYFTTALLGSTSTTTVSVTDLGSSPLTISQLSLSGPNSAAFSLSHDTCQGTTFPAAGHCTVDVSFSPNTTGSLTAFLIIADNAVISPQVVALSGNGTAVQLTPASLDFGSVSVGTISQPKIITATNTGTAAVKIAKISMTGAGSTAFLELNTCGHSLNPQAVCSIVIWFIPTATGVEKSSVSFMLSTGGPQDDPNNVPVSGTGT